MRECRHFVTYRRKERKMIVKNKQREILEEGRDRCLADGFGEAGLVELLNEITEAKTIDVYKVVSLARICLTYGYFSGLNWFIDHMDDLRNEEIGE